MHRIYSYITKQGRASLYNRHFYKYIRDNILIHCQLKYLLRSTILLYYVSEFRTIPLLSLVIIVEIEFAGGMKSRRRTSNVKLHFSDEKNFQGPILKWKKILHFAECLAQRKRRISKSNSMVEHWGNTEVCKKKLLLELLKSDVSKQLKGRTKLNKRTQQGAQRFCA